jgi:hypothetical protein
METISVTEHKKHLNPSLLLDPVDEVPGLDLHLHELIDLKVADAAAYCERHLDPTILSNELKFIDRDGLCSFLGIGDSTLSGWLNGVKGGAPRVPRMAKEACVLMRAVILLQQEIKRLRRDRREQMIILKDGEKFHLVRPEPDVIGAVIGKVIARDIPDEATARILATSHRIVETLRDMRNEEIEVIDPSAYHDQEEIDKFEQRNSRILRDLLAAMGIEKFITTFSSQSVPIFAEKARSILIDILAEGNPEPELSDALHAFLRAHPRRMDSR